MTPLFVVEPIPWDYDNDQPAKTIDSHLINKGTSKGTELAQCWGTSPAFVDCTYLGDTPLQSGEHPLAAMCSGAQQAGLPLLPVVGVHSTPDYRAAAAGVVSQQGRGACVRLSPVEWPSAAGQPALDGLMNDVGVAPGDVDLVLDMGADVAAAPTITQTAVYAEIAALPYLQNWRALIVAGAGFPANTGGLGKGISVLPRAEWDVYQQIVAGPVARVPSFGDYAIAHPDPTVDVNPKFMSISANLRYTSGDTWLVAKGSLFKGPGGTGEGGAALVALAPQLVAHPGFMAGHCGTDGWVQGLLAKGASGGNPEAWRRYGTLHHLQLITEQLAILHGP